MTTKPDLRSLIYNPDFLNHHWLTFNTVAQLNTNLLP